ncbi:hypothetical protein C1T17_08035 [Sphingobium sp. SCG-1]|uniref:hypothetical protein n=1 Tax=Sphingobium sp. SCG-1 TaxID=2072936 RepID=UPI000CD67B8B|nr:hypothetical protein [Sphingobium sp. SCG-1]AUW58064.1 hypothetical protein C1T17_08035 [Sphingobium sp. SCG-1]
MVSNSQQHRELIEIGRSILDAAQEHSEGSLRQVARLRLTLSRAVSDHVADELRLIRRVRPCAESGPHAPLMKSYHEGIRDWRQRLVECTVKWPSREISANPDGFIADYMPIHQALETRMRWEEDIFYPAVLSKAHLD